MTRIKFGVQSSPMCHLFQPYIRNRTISRCTLIVSLNLWWRTKTTIITSRSRLLSLAHSHYPPHMSFPSSSTAIATIGTKNSSTATFSLASLMLLSPLESLCTQESGPYALIKNLSEFYSLGNSSLSLWSFSLLLESLFILSHPNSLNSQIKSSNTLDLQSLLSSLSSAWIKSFISSGPWSEQSARPPFTTFAAVRLSVWSLLSSSLLCHFLLKTGCFIHFWLDVFVSVASKCCISARCNRHFTHLRSVSHQ